ncbi:MAG: ABC transporter ATP-binding protein [Acidobacteriaceae bacterium]|nr:ABC transporter ATP-binding protein [Acidobacteriaceae bacterium]MBV9763524.1 ABC transporter ATP-binding protein [Acidobacteriaceae bacterium]
MPLLEVRNVTKVYPTEGAPVMALQNVSLEAEPGELIALVGRSGCGKSTLLNMCGAMDLPTSGEVILEGQSTASLDDASLTCLRREKVGFIFQSFQLLHTLTAAENVELPLLLARRKNPRGTALERLRWVDMEGYGDRFPHQLSGGQQQRVAIARALAHDPRLLLADEPTGNLDTVTGEIVLGLLHRTAREFGVAVIMATHSAEAASVAFRTVHLRDGRMQEAAVLL